MISHANKFVFFDIVKTGGSSINQILMKHGGRGKHHSVSRPLPDLAQNEGLERIVKPDLIKEYFTFSIVRNPFDRLISLYSFCQNAPLQRSFSQAGWKGIMPVAGKNGISSLKEQQRKTYWPADFQLFVEWLIDYKSFYADFTLEKYIKMSEWLKDDDGIISVDFVGRYENLAQDVSMILSRLQLPAEEIPFLNKSENVFKKDAAGKIWSDNHFRNTICNYYKEDFELFNYSMDFKEAGSYKLLIGKID